MVPDDAIEQVLSIRDAVSQPDLEEVRKLFLEYRADIGVDLCFQGLSVDLASLPASYSRPARRLFLARDGDLVVGCIALRFLQGHDGEMKRLFVRRAARGRGVGHLLTARLLDEARHAGYTRILLDTLPSMGEALTLYRTFGFTEVAAYRHNPTPGALYFALALQAA